MLTGKQIMRVLCGVALAVLLVPCSDAFATATPATANIIEVTATSSDGSTSAQNFTIGVNDVDVFSKTLSQRVKKNTVGFRVMCAAAFQA